MAIKNLVFGSAIDKEVTDELNNLQRSNNNQQLSQKTTFVRMWVGLQTYNIVKQIMSAKEKEGMVLGDNQYFTDNDDGQVTLNTIEYTTKKIYQINNHNEFGINVTLLE